MTENIDDQLPPLNEVLRWFYSSKLTDEQREMILDAIATELKKTM